MAQFDDLELQKVAVGADLSADGIKQTEHENTQSKRSEPREEPQAKKKAKTLAGKKKSGSKKPKGKRAEAPAAAAAAATAAAEEQEQEITAKAAKEALEKADADEQRATATSVALSMLTDDDRLEHAGEGITDELLEDIVDEFESGLVHADTTHSDNSSSEEEEEAAEEGEDDDTEPVIEEAVLYAPNAEHNIVAFVHTRTLLEQQARLRQQVDPDEAQNWEVGSRVTVNSTHDSLFGTIVEVHDDGTFDVSFDIGGGAKHVLASRLSQPVTTGRGMRVRHRRDRRTDQQRKLDRETAILYDTQRKEELQKDTRASKITYGLVRDTIVEGAQVCAVFPLIRIGQDGKGTHRRVPASMGSGEREPEYVPIAEVIDGTLAVGAPGSKTHFSTWSIDTEWEASVVSEEKKRCRIEKQQR